MKNDRTKRLAHLGSERLAQALAELAMRDANASNTVERLISSPSKNVGRFKKQLAALRRSKHFYSYHEASGFADDLRSMLRDLESAHVDEKTGLAYVAEFFKHDLNVFNRCDDSDGNVGDVFRMDARDLFARYAAAVGDKELVAATMLELLDEDDYGVRDGVFDAAGGFLPEAALRNLTDELWTRAKDAAGDQDKSRWLRLIEPLARQLKDPALFEKARRASWGKIGPAMCRDIAEAYLDAGDAKTALEWLQKVSKDEIFQRGEREKLLLAVHKALGDTVAVADTAWRIFDAYRAVDSLDGLLAVIGADRRNAMITEAAAAIHHDKKLSLGDAQFLIDVGEVDGAEKYLRARVAEINGDYYPDLLKLAKAFEKDKRFVVASIIHRALLESILKRALSRYYHHGVRYLVQLDRLAGGVKDWGDVRDHAKYLADLRAKHKLKQSFWTKYAAKAGGAER